MIRPLRGWAKGGMTRKHAGAKHFRVPLVLWVAESSRQACGAANAPGLRNHFAEITLRFDVLVDQCVLANRGWLPDVRAAAPRAKFRRLLAVGGLAASLLPLTACNGFFQCEKASCTTPVGSTPPTGTPGTPTPNNTGDYAYIANSSAGTTYLSEYSITSGALNSLGTISLGYIPVQLAVSPNNSFLYVASVPGTASPGIYLYTIGSTGALSAGNNGAALVTDTIAAMAVSPDGNWLYTVNNDGFTMAEYSVNRTTGALSLVGDLALPGTTCSLSAALPVSQSCSIAVSPNGEYVVASLGPSGDAVFSYSSSGGIGNDGAFTTISSGYSVSNPTGDFSVALDGNNYAYIAQTSSLTVYGISSLSSIVDEGTVSYTEGSAPRAVTLSRKDNYVYTANEGAGTISGFGISGSGQLNEVSGSPVAGPANVSALGADNTGDYLLAVGYNANTGVRLYSIASTGALTQVAQAGSGADDAYPALVAMTH